MIQRWWSDKYDLPPNDPRFLGVPLAEHVREFLYDLAVRRADVRVQLESGEGNRAVMQRALDTLDRVLGDDADDGPDEEMEARVAWAEEVERAIDEGREPDWSRAR